MQLRFTYLKIEVIQMQASLAASPLFFYALLWFDKELCNGASKNSI